MLLRNTLILQSLRARKRRQNFSVDHSIIYIIRMMERYSVVFNMNTYFKFSVTCLLLSIPVFQSIFFNNLLSSYELAE